MKSIDRELQSARNNLLDLSMRNRLLNFRPTKTRTIKVIDEIPREIYDLLVINEKIMEFKAKPKPPKIINNKKTENTVLDSEKIYSAVFRIDTTVDTVHGRHLDKYLQTTLEIEDLEKNVQYISQQSQSFFEEQGYTVLYLALGFLEWTEVSGSIDSRKAPLILVPVLLEQTKVGEPFRLSWTGEDIFTNISLQSQLSKQDVLLPEFEMPLDKNDIDGYFKSVMESISKKSDWKVLNDIYLGFFSFTKFVMYKDLDQNSWPIDRSPKNNPLVSSIFNPGVEENIHPFLEREVDVKLKSKNLYHVMDADPSQIAVIEDVKSGCNLVVEGPPGTGKSQTITNIIAELLASGKTVLFVSEKMAALEVVKSRLDEVGLGAFCLELHSRKSNKKDVLKELQNATYLPSPRLPSEKNQFENLESVKKELNDYATALREPFGSMDLSPYDLFCMKEGALLHFNRNKRTMQIIKLNDVEKCTSFDWNATISSLSDISDILSLVKPLKTHQWKGCQPGMIFPSDEIGIKNLITECQNSLEQIINDISDLCHNTCVKHPINIQEVQSSIQASKVIASSKPTEKNILMNEKWNSQNAEAELLIQQIKDFQNQRSELSSRFVDSAFDQGVDTIIKRYSELLSYDIVKFLDNRSIDHEWKTSTSQKLTEYDKNELKRLVDNCKSSFDHLEYTIDQICEICSVKRPLNLAQIQSSIHASKILAASKPIEKNVLLNEEWNSQNTRAEFLIQQIKDFSKQRFILSTRFISTAFEQDIDYIIKKYNELLSYDIVKFFDSRHTDHKWKVSASQKIPIPNKNEIKTVLNNCQSSLNNLEYTIDQICEICSVKLPLNLAQIQSSIHASKILAASKPIEMSVLLNEEWNSQNTRAELLIQQIKEYRKQEPILNSRFVDNAFVKDIDSIIKQYKGYCAEPYILRIFNAKHRSLKREISLLYKGIAPQKSELVIADLNELSKFIRLREDIISANNVGVSLFGSYWKNEESNPEALETFRDWIIAFRQQLLLNAFDDKVFEKICSGVHKEKIERTIESVSNTANDFISQCTNLSKLVGVEYGNVFSNDDQIVFFNDIDLQLKSWINGLLELQKWISFSSKLYNDGIASDSAELIVSDLNDLSTCLQLKENIRSKNSLGIALFGSNWKNEESSPADLEIFGKWIIEFRQQLLLNSFDDRVFEKISLGVSKERVELTIENIVNSKENFIKQYTNLADYVGIESESIFSADNHILMFKQIDSVLNSWIDGLLELQKWISFSSRLYNDGIAPDKAELILSDLKELSLCIQLRNDIRSINKEGSALFGTYWKNESSNLEDLESFGKWVVEFRQQFLNNSFDNSVIDKIYIGISKDEVEKSIQNLLKGINVLENRCNKLFERLGTDSEHIFGCNFDSVLFEDLDSRLKLWNESTHKLQEWGQFSLIRSKCLNTFASPIISLIDSDTLEADDVVPCFKGNFAENFLKSIFLKRENLANFMGELHGKKIEEFVELDKKVILLNRKRLAYLLHSRKPAITGGVSRNSEAGILLGEFSRKRKHMPIRKLMSNCGNLIQKIKPCFMMSPLSIAQFLDPLNIHFDVVVFDEASQVKPEDALGALLRAKQAVIIGDTKQLPPTSFFDKVVDSNDNFEEDPSSSVSDIESILHLCKRSFLTKTLRWHYRSKHDSLIAVSSQEFYDNNLVFYPSPITDPEQLGLKFVHLPGTIYDRGRTSTNRMEAQAIAQAAIEHYRKNPEKSLGIGTFNIKQQQVIREEIDFQLIQNPGMEPFFERTRAEHFFIKNLETIQGDERDVIFISVCFGFDSKHNLSLNFGALNLIGGERRLNVLITRAREKCVVFANFKANELDIDTSASLGGLKSLKVFLDFAENRSSVNCKTMGFDNDDLSSLEDSVYEFLTNCGYEVHKRIGCAAYKVDLAVVNPASPNNYILGIEFDGIKYQSSLVARDRDRLRQQVLESLYWRIFHIWSTDWYRNHIECQNRLKKAVEEARHTSPVLKQILKTPLIEKNEFKYAIREADEQMFSEQNLVPVPEKEVSEYKIYSNTSNLINFELSQKELEKLVVNVVDIEGPVHLEEVIKRIRTNNGFKRTGYKIKDSIMNAINTCEIKGSIIRKEDFLFDRNSTVNLRKRDSSNPLKIEYICDQEIELGIVEVLKNQYSTSPDELVVQTSKLLGFKSTGEQVRIRITDIISKMIARNKLRSLLNGRVELI